MYDSPSLTVGQVAHVLHSSTKHNDKHADGQQMRLNRVHEPRHDVGVSLVGRIEAFASQSKVCRGRPALRPAHKYSVHVAAQAAQEGRRRPNDGRAI